MSSPAEEEAKGKVWEAYRAWVAHVHPSESTGRSPCWPCIHAEAPSKEGCEEGITLYGTYRLAKILRGAVRAT